MGAVWGTGHAVAHPSIVQTVEQLRRGGAHLYRGAKWISIDESKPAIGIAGDMFEIFVSGGGSASVETTKPRPTSQSGPGVGGLGA